MKKLRPLRALCLLFLSTALAIGAVEAALHVFPALVPSSYRRTFPLHGVGFFHPDLLEETALEDMPMPLYVGSHKGPPPADLVELGLAPPEAAAMDYARWGDVEISVDELGLPNASIPERAEIVLLGDSFGVSAGLAAPEGLALLLQKELGRSVYNLGIAGLGPFQERNVLMEYGLPKQPRLVVWLFFGGNDLNDALVTLYHQSEGRKTWGDVHGDGRPPRFRLLAILRHLRGRRIDAAQTTPLPGLRFELGEGSESAELRTWMHPGYLQALTRSREEWLADPAFGPTLDVLDEINGAVQEAGSQLLFVYLPSKAQALLPVVAQDKQLLFEMAYFGSESSFLTAESFLPLARANANRLEDLMREACAEREIPFLSTTSLLEEGARRGEPGFLVADTHWDLRGHMQVLPALLESIRALLD